MRIAINGFGRIGRSVFRVLNNHKDIEVVAINDIFDKGALVYLLKYDTVMGRFPEKVNFKNDILIAPIIYVLNQYKKTLQVFMGSLLTNQLPGQ